MKEASGEVHKTSFEKHNLEHMLARFKNQGGWRGSATKKGHILHIHIFPDTITQCQCCLDCERHLHFLF